MLHNALRAMGTGGDYEIAGGTIASVTTSTTTLSVAYPASIQKNDLLIIVGTCGVSSLASLSGWTDLSGASAAAIILYKYADGTESGSVTVSLSPTSAGAGAQMFRIRRTSGNSVEPYTWIGGFATTVNVSPPLQRFNGIDLLLYVACQPGAGRTVTTQPTNFTAISSRTTNVPLFSWYSVNRGTGNINGTFSGGMSYRVIAINLG